MFVLVLIRMFPRDASDMPRSTGAIIAILDMPRLRVRPVLYTATDRLWLATYNLHRREPIAATASADAKERDVRRVAAKNAIEAMTVEEPIQAWIIDDTGSSHRESNRSAYSSTRGQRGRLPTASSV